MKIDIYKIMANLLTLEEKKYLQRICRYLGSLGMSHGSIDFEMEYGEFDTNDYNWNRITHFSNNYSAEIPDGLKEICKKLLAHVEENDLVGKPDVDNLNWERIEIDVDCDDSTISVVHDYNYYSTGDVESISREIADYGDEDDENNLLRTIFNDLEDNDEIEERVLRLDYNGSGDSGYIEDSFTDGTDVPGDLSDFCYQLLENNFGGWEINEGSQGYFEIDLDEKVITLNHTTNLDEQARDTIIEEDF